MEHKKDLDSIIKNSFDKLNQGAPDALWGKLASALDADSLPPPEKELPLNLLDEKVKKSFSSLNEKAPAHAWTAINRRLSIEKVWRGISEELDHTNHLYWLRMRMAAAVLLLLLSGAGAYILFTQDAATKKVAEVAEDASAIQHTSTIAAANSEKKAFEEKAAGGQVAMAEHIRSAQTAVRPSDKENADAYKADRAKQKQKSVKPVGFPEQAANLLETAALPGQQTFDTASHVSDSGMNDEPEQHATYTASNGLSSSALPGKSTTSSAREATLKQGSVSGLTYSNATLALLKDAAAVTIEANRAGIDQAQLSIIPYNVAGQPFLYGETISNLEVEVLEVAPTVLPEVAVVLPAEEKKMGFRLQKFSAGPVMTYNNSWLLNNETRSSYDKNSLIATDLTYKQNWGLALNYELSRNNILAAEAYVVSKAGQQYKMYREGEYLKKELELRYYKLYLQYQRNFLTYGKTVPSWLTVKAGAYGGYLQKQLGEIRQEESSYADFDYGLKLALGQENRIGKVVLGYGVSSERGLNNVFRGTESLPAEFNKTYILNFGTYLNIRYAF